MSIIRWSLPSARYSSYFQRSQKMTPAGLVLSALGQPREKGINLRNIPPVPTAAVATLYCQNLDQIRYFCFRFGPCTANSWYRTAADDNPTFVMARKRKGGGSSSSSHVLVQFRSCIGLGSLEAVANNSVVIGEERKESAFKQS